MSTIYSPIDVYNFAENGNVDELIIALNQGNKSINWYRDDYGSTALHAATRKGYYKIVQILLDRGIDINSKNNSGYTALHEASFVGNVNIVKILLDKGIDTNCKDYNGWTALHLAARYDHMNIVEILLDGGTDINSKEFNDWTALHDAAFKGHMNVVEILLDRGIDIDDGINKYTPNENGYEDDEGNIIEYYADCRPMIFAEVEHRRKRDLFDSFINHHIEYQPYINNIYTLCYPTSNLQVAKPPVGWIRAEAIRDKYYLDEIFFYLHMHVANCYTNNRPGYTVLSSLMSKSSDHFANNSDKTSTLMIILTDRLRIYLKPNQDLGVEVPYVEKYVDNNNNNNNNDVDDGNNSN